jgi:hypothetical protein
MLWGVDDEVIARFGAAGIARERIELSRETYTFDFPGSPSAFLGEFRKYYGPTMNAFEAAEKAGRADALAAELEALFASQNQSGRADATRIPATFLRVTVRV